ncbi:transposase [Bradyrhizobium sp. 14AA]
MSNAFAGPYPDFGRPSNAPEKLLRAMLLQVSYGIRSERPFMERLEFDCSPGLSVWAWTIGCGITRPSPSTRRAVRR